MGIRLDEHCTNSYGRDQKKFTFRNSNTHRFTQYLGIRNFILPTSHAH